MDSPEYSAAWSSRNAAGHRSISAPRIDELTKRQVEKIVLSKQYAVEAVIENPEKALGRRAVKIGKADGESEVYVYRGDVANRALQMIGSELGLFTEKRETTHKRDNKLSQLSDLELVELLQQEAQPLLEDHSREVTAKTGLD